VGSPGSNRRTHGWPRRSRGRAESGGAAHPLQLLDLRAELVDALPQCLDLRARSRRRAADPVVLRLQPPAAVAFLADEAAEQGTGLRVDAGVLEEFRERILAFS